MIKLLIYLYAFVCLIAYILTMNRSLNKNGASTLNFTIISFGIITIYLIGATGIVYILK